MILYLIIVINMNNIFFHESLAALRGEVGMKRKPLGSFNVLTVNFSESVVCCTFLVLFQLFEPLAGIFDAPVEDLFLLPSLH